MLSTQSAVANDELPRASQFAVIELSGTQYKVTPGCVVCTQKLDVPVGSLHRVTRVLLAGTADKTVIGQPQIPGASVTLQIAEHNLMDKVIIFKKKRRKGYKRWNGHRQPVTIFRVEGISVPELGT